MATGYHSGLWQPLEKEKPQQRRAQAPPPPLRRKLRGRGTELSRLCFLTTQSQSVRCFLVHVEGYKSSCTALPGVSGTKTIT